ncbi:MAG: protease-like activity factor CPAF [Bdellovibrionales bacterium]|nr:protease-like activity factor CPAF [Bdellovibrionales bacterium]
MKKLLAFLSIIALSSSSYAVNTYTKEQMKRELQFVADTYRTAYAPTQWKNKHIGWDLELELDNALGKIDGKSDLSVKDYHKILKDFFRSTQDYHVGYRFHSTERAVLPFSVKSAEGKVYIAHVNREKLSQVAFPYNPGDEVVEFGGRPVNEVLDELAATSGMGVERTDRALAELFLTSRAGSRAMDVPRGTIDIGLKKPGAESVSHIQLIWEYTPEDLTFPGTESVTPLGFEKQSLNTENNFVNRIKNTQMTLFGYEDFMAEETGKDSAEKHNPFEIGGKKSYVPTLGKVVWEADESNHYHAYIYKNKEGHLIGYVRIAHYGAGAEEFKQFKEIIKKYEELTDALVIDEINNPGGSLFYIYALNSVLTDKIIYTPKEHIRIYPEHIVEASNTLKQMAKITNDEEAQKALGTDWSGYPVTYQTVEYLKEFSRFILAEWQAGKTLTDPTYIWGADKVNPNKDVNYTKPILILTNELDFSGGDFFPAILQDNKRATIMGVRTAGAGGFVLRTSVPSALGLEFFSFTGSLAKRINDQPIENLGVTPDIDYEITEKDIRSGFSEYGKAINEAINKMAGIESVKEEENKETKDVEDQVKP